MALTEDAIRESLDAVAAIEPAYGAALQSYGYPGPRSRESGYPALLRTIVGQQVSVAAAASVWNKMEALLGTDCPPGRLLETDFDGLRACGLSRQKQGYARSLAEMIVSGGLNLDDLPADDDEAIALLTQIKGIGRWSAEIYLLFAEGRTDIWPAGDLAVQLSVGRILGRDERPSEKDIRAWAEAWRPHRSAVAILAWHCYNTKVL